MIGFVGTGRHSTLRSGLVVAFAMGWIGTCGSIAAYLMLSRGTWHSASLRYATVNGVCGLMAAGASAAYGAWPSAVSNLLWSAIAAQSAVTTLRDRRAPASAPTEPHPVSAAGSGANASESAALLTL